jgi:hypothetical protein
VILTAVYWLVFWSLFPAVSLGANAHATSQIISVRGLGARGDGHTDDTAAIGRALSAAAHGALYFPRGIYMVTRPLDLPTTPIHIFGDGFESVIVQTSDNIGIFNVPSGSSGLQIDHLALQETGTVHGHQLGRGAVYINPGGDLPPVSHLSFHDNSLHCASTSCIAATCVIDSRIWSNHFDNDGTGEHGIYLSSNENCYSQNVMIEANTFQSNYRGREETGVPIEIAIQLRAAKHLTIRDNRINGWSDGVVLIPEESHTGGDPNVADVSIESNVIESTADDCFVNFYGSARNIVLRNNTFRFCGRNGIRSNTPLLNSSIERNTVLGSGGSGMRLNFVTRSIVNANVVRDSGRAGYADADRASGIRLEAGNTDNLFTGNLCGQTRDKTSQLFGLSIGGEQTRLSNIRNCFHRNVFSGNSKGEVDAYGILSDCAELKPRP